MTTFLETLEVKQSLSGHYYARVAISTKDDEQCSIFLKFAEEPTKEQILKEVEAHSVMQEKQRNAPSCSCELPFALADIDVVEEGA